MNPYHGYGAPPGYPPPHIPPSSESHASPYNRLASNGTAPTAQYGDAAQQSFAYNRNIIPGLGLNYSHSGTVVQHAPSHTLQQNPQPLAMSGANPGKSTGVMGGNRAAGSHAASPSNQDLEEGELSEGELEDFYEPQEDDTDGHSSYDPANPSAPKFPGTYSAEQHNPPNGHIDNIRTDSEPYHNTARERSGSYSPYLSPREMNSRQSLESQRPGQDASPSFYWVDTTAPASSRQSGIHGVEASPGHLEETPSPDMVEQSREKAREAISSLWPFKIGYSDYIAAGIDAGVLRELFASLGFEVSDSDTQQKTQPPVEISREQPSVQTVQNPETGPTEPHISKEAVAPTNEDQQSTSKTEERKDRIARLLAAKGSKPAAPVAKPVQIDTGKSTPKTTAGKTQSEKSKLLHQKMEALRKSREALIKKAAEVNDSSAAEPVMTVEGKTDSGVKDGLVANHTGNEPIPSSSQTPVSAQEEDIQAGSSIPGLFLSSTPQLDTVNPPHKRPIASDFDHLSGFSKRPFGQKRDSRPFLIDVSDDEDDAEMEIDSPENQPATLHRPSTPGWTQTALRDVQQEPFPAYQTTSPAALPTPPQGSMAGVPGRPDLESMNKKIEEMKRKIAEAEARKRAKQSRQSSTTPSQANGLSEVQSPAITPVASSSHAPASPTAVDGRETSRQNLPSTVLSPLHVSKRPHRTAQSHEERRTRSRAASERISLIEAHRRQQLLRLETLRSQIANIEKEIEDSRLEEERLKEDVDSASEPEAGPQSPAAVETHDSEVDAQEVSPQDEASPASDAMETSGTPTRSRNARSQSYKADQTTAADGENMDLDPDQASELEAQSPVEAHSKTPELSQPLKEQDRQDDTERLSEAVSVSKTEVQHMSDPEESTRMPVEDAAIRDDGSEDMSDDYEPPEAGSTTSMSRSPQAIGTTNPDSNDNDGVTKPSEPGGSPQMEPASNVSSDGQEHAPEVERKEKTPSPEMAAEPSRAHPYPYETPLRYFHAYRFHPLYKESVSGGIRSLTYSNKIDAHKALCPDQQVGLKCSAGDSCQYQHFESMQVSDSQIVTVLTEYGDFEGEQKQKYINGLRELLTDLRNRKVKELDAISQGIIEFRARFLEDRSRVLPLGSVSL